MKRTKCEECGGKVVTKDVEYRYLGEHIGKFPAEVCSKCGETVFEEKTSEEIEKRVKAKGLYGLGSSTKVGTAGSSLVIRITKRLAEFLQLEKGAEVHIHPEDKNRLVIETVKQ